MTTLEKCEVCNREKMPPCPHQAVQAGANTCMTCGKYVSGEYVHASLPLISGNLCLRDWYADGRRDKECFQRGFQRLSAERPLALARAHAEGLEAGAGKLVKLCDSDPDLTDFALSRIHAQARKLRSLIPAAPEVILPAAEEET